MIVVYSGGDGSYTMVTYFHDYETSSLMSVWGR
jgi:hypothetical protein